MTICYPSFSRLVRPDEYWSFNVLTIKIFLATQNRIFLVLGGLRTFEFFIQIRLYFSKFLIHHIRLDISNFLNLDFGFVICDPKNSWVPMFIWIGPLFRIHSSLDLSYLYLVGRSAKFDDEGNEGREGSTVAEFTRSYGWLFTFRDVQGLPRFKLGNARNPAYIEVPVGGGKTLNDHR